MQAFADALAGTGKPLVGTSGAGMRYRAGLERAGTEDDVIAVGNSAGQAVVHFARFARRVTLVVRAESLAESMSAYLVVCLRNKLVDWSCEHSSRSSTAAYRHAT